MSYCIILTTCPNETEADSLATGLVKKKLAACVQATPVKSVYTWKNDLCVDPEIKLAIKTRARLYPAVEDFILRHHSFDVPQIIQIPFSQGSQDYLDWIDLSTG